MTWFLSGLCSSLRCRPRARYRPAFGEPDLGKTGDRCSLYKDMYDLKSYIIHMYIYILGTDELGLVAPDGLGLAGV